MTAGARPRAIVVGTNFGGAVHVPALRAAGFEVRAIVGRDSQRTEQLAEQLGIPLATDTLGDALAGANADLVVVSSPDASHVEHVRQVVDAGLNVLCEKPFTSGIAEAQELHSAALRAGVKHYLGTQFRFANGQAAMSAAVRAGRIGTPLMGSITFLIPLLSTRGDDALASWTSPSAFLVAYIPHVIDRITTTLGDVAAVSAELHPRGHTFTVQLRTRASAMVVLQASAAAHGPAVIGTRILGSSGTVWDEGGDSAWLADRHGTVVLDAPSGFAIDADAAAGQGYPVYDNGVGKSVEFVPYVRLYETIHADLTGSARPYVVDPPTFDDGLAQMQVIAAIEEAHETRRWVEIRAS